MVKNFLESIRSKSESHRRGVAVGLSFFITLIVFLGWVGQRGFLGGNSSVAEAPKVEVAKQTASAANTISPLESSKKSFMSGFEEIKKTYQGFKESVSSVLIPFISGIEVYENK